MSPSDSQPNAGPGNNASENDATVEEVKAIISKAQAGAADPISTGIMIVSSFRENFTISGDTLRQALADSHIAPAEPWVSILSGLRDISKIENKVVVARAQQLETDVRGTRIKLQEVITFEFTNDSSLPRISNIQGVAAHKLIWLNIQQLELIQDQQQKVLRVMTSGGSRDFALPQTSA
jgi:hypothetical protein